MPAESSEVLTVLRNAVRGTPYDGRLFLVGGYVRDKVMGMPSAGDDLDLVLEGDALTLAEFLWERKVAQYRPVVYPRFGTAMVMVEGRNVELVTARTESYMPESRKPETVRPGTILDDARRRDFTINTLLENLQTGEIVDPLGMAHSDLRAHLIRTPTDPALTFADDPLRMLRAIRFAARFGFHIAAETWEAIQANAERLSIISSERIREEFTKTLMTSRPRVGLELLLDSGLLALFLPELNACVGVSQNAFHIYDVWNHTLVAVSALPQDSPLSLRLAALFHDIGKPDTRTVDEKGSVHFYNHQAVGAQMTRRVMQRLKFSNEEITHVTQLVAEHMRIGEYQANWSDSAVRRLIRELGEGLPKLFALHAADVAGLGAGNQDMSRAHDLRSRVNAVQQQQDVTQLTSPLNGQEIMARFGLAPGKRVGDIKDYLTNEVVEGRLAPDDKDAASALVIRYLENL